MFEHCEAVLVPLGGIAVALSPSGHASSDSVTRYPLFGVSFWSRLDVEKRDTIQSVCTMNNGQCVDVFEHCEAVPVTLGGIAVALSPSGHAHPTL